MRKLLPILLLFLISSCENSISPEDIQLMNGYWEIEKVVFADGAEKDFDINMTYDYIELQGLKGFRRKGAPRFDGKFESNDVLETIEVISTDDKTIINYSTEYSKWTEELKEISKDKMILVNADNKEYHYKRTAPLNFTEDGKTTK